MTVVVGVDGTPGSHPAIRLARQEARYRDVPLLAVMAYGTDTVLGGPPARPAASATGPAGQREMTEATLRQVVSDALGEHAAGTGTRVVQGMPGRGLVEVAQHERAVLVVLAARSDGAVSRLLGTVSQYVLRNAPCPVLVVPSG